MIQFGKIAHELSFTRFAQSLVAMACATVVGVQPAAAKKTPEEKAKVSISSGDVQPAQGLPGETFKFSAVISANKTAKDLSVALRVMATVKIKTPIGPTFEGVTLKSGESQTFEMSVTTLSAKTATYSLYVTVTDTKRGEVVTEGIASAVTVTVPPQPRVSSLGVGLYEEERSGTYIGDSHLDYYNRFGLNIVRIPFRWDQLQSVPFGPLEATELSRIRQIVNGAYLRKIRVVLSAEGGRHRAGMLGSEELPASALGDLWQRIAREFRDDPAVYGLQIMERPDVLSGTWPAIAQETVDTIRRYHGNQMIFVDGECRSDARTWAQCNPDLNIIDPLNKTAYSASLLLVGDRFGEPLDVTNEFLAAEAVQPFLAWAQAKGARAVIGQLGLLWDDPRHVSLLNNYLASTVAQCAITFLYRGGASSRQSSISLEPVLDAETGILTDKLALTSKIDATMPESCRAGW